MKNTRIGFQKVNGPFSITQEYEYDDLGNELDVHRIFKNGKLVETFERSALTDDGSYVIALNYVAKELEKKFPQYFDREEYYLSNLNNEVPLSFLSDYIDKTIEVYQKELDINKRELEDYGYGAILDEKNHLKAVFQEFIGENFYKEEYTKLHELGNEFHEKRVAYQIEKELFDKKEQPTWFNFIARYDYNQEKKSLEMKRLELDAGFEKMEKLADGLEKKLECNEEYLKVCEHVEHLLDKIDNINETLTACVDLKNQAEWDTIKDRNQLIPFQGDCRDLENILFQFGEIRTGVEELQIKEQNTIGPHASYVESLKDALKICNLPRNAREKDLFNAYAKKVTSQDGGIWKNDTNQKIVKTMLESGIKPLKIQNAIKHSPDKVEKPYSFIKEVSKDMQYSNRITMKR